MALTNNSQAKLLEIACARHPSKSVFRPELAEDFAFTCSRVVSLTPPARCASRRGGLVDAYEQALNF